MQSDVIIIHRTANHCDIFLILSHICRSIMFYPAFLLITYNKKRHTADTICIK